MHPAARGLLRAPGQRPGARWHSAAAAVARALSSPVFGLALIACIVVYLSLASAAPGLLATALRTEPSGLYRHWLLVSAGLLLCLGVLASLVRTPLSPASAGAWCGHLGVLVLACGAGWYALAAVSGDCIALRTAAGWSTIAYFQESGAYAAYVSGGREPAPRQTRLSPRQLAALPAKPVRLDCDVVGMEARAVDFRQAAALRPSADAEIVDSGEENVPALCVELAVGDWSARTWVPFAGWQDLAPQHRVDLPGGGAACLSFARPEVTLPEPVTVLTAEYLRHPGSAIPLDYRCQVSVGGRQTEIGLNKPLTVGPYQLSQGAWLPSPDDVGYIVFLVSSRPGLLLVWLGCLMIAAGLPYAFYVRPLILRRRKGGRRVKVGAVIVAFLLGLAVVAQAGEPGGAAGDLFDEQTLEFLQGIDSGSVALLPVQHRGRPGVMDTAARDYLERTLGTESIDGAAPAAAYLELYLNSGHYLDRPLIYVRQKAMRQAIAPSLKAQTREAFDRTGRLPPAALMSGQDLVALAVSGRAGLDDLARAKGVDSLEDVLISLSQRREFMLPLAWLGERCGAFLALDAGDPDWAEHWRLLPGDASPLRLAALRQAWRSRDAGEVNSLCAAWLAERSGKAAARARLEVAYNRTRRWPAIMASFAAALAILIAAAASSGRTLRRLGLAVFSLATVAMLAGFVARWVLSGRAWWLPPIMNQYEAVTGSALLGAMIALLLELIYKRGYFALAAAFYAAAALLAGLIFPQAMDAGLAATHGILNSPIMGAHVAVIILGHALAGMTGVISLAYLAGAAWQTLAGGPLTSSSADLAGPSGRDALAAVDRCNLITAQLAAWSIVAGTILGAFWGDSAWGRWWGWDPKETWALITALVYLAVLHARFVVPRRYRGLAMSVGCVIGCGAMVFNWTVVNFLLAGKHSYA